MAYDHIFYVSVRHAYSHVTTPLIPCGPRPLAARRMRTQRSMLSTGVLALLGWTAPQAWHSGRAGEHSCLGARPPFGPKHAHWGSCLDSELASPWPPHPVVPERQSCHVLLGAWHCPGHTQNLVQKRPSPRKHTIVGNPYVTSRVPSSTFIHSSHKVVPLYLYCEEFYLLAQQLLVRWSVVL